MSGDADELRQAVMGCVECDRPSTHDFYVNGGAFSWCWPKFTRNRPADRKPRIGWNRYPHNTIGVSAVLFGWAWGVRWKGTKRENPLAAVAAALPREDETP